MRSDVKMSSISHCQAAILNEIEFWKLPLDEIEICNCSDEDYRLCGAPKRNSCEQLGDSAYLESPRFSFADARATRWSVVRKRKNNDEAESSSRLSRNIFSRCNVFEKISSSSLGQKVWLILEEPSSSIAAKVSTALKQQLFSYNKRLFRV